MDTIKLFEARSLFLKMEKYHRNEHYNTVTGLMETDKFVYSDHSSQDITFLIPE